MRVPRAMQVATVAVVLAGALPSLASAQGRPGQGRDGSVRLTESPTPRLPSTLPDITYEELVASSDRTTTYNPAALGIGAVGGVLLFNAFSGTFAGPLTAGVALESAIATSRVYAVSSAVAGAFIGQWIYDRTIAR